MTPEYREYAIDAVEHGHQGNPDFERSLLGTALRDWQRDVVLWRRASPKRLALAMAFHWKLGRHSLLRNCPTDLVRRYIIHHLEDL